MSSSFRKVEKERDHFRTGSSVLATSTTFLLIAFYSFIPLHTLSRYANISSKRSNQGVDSCLMKSFEKNMIPIAIFQVKHFSQSHVTSIWPSQRF